MASEQLQVNFRMPADLKARLEHASQASGRTLTAEIVHRLEKSLEDPDLPAPAKDLKLIYDEVMAIRKSIARIQVHLIYAKDGSLRIYGAHEVASATLMEAGIEAEQKHDCHVVAAEDALTAHQLLNGEPVLQVVSVTYEAKQDLMRMVMSAGNDPAKALEVRAAFDQLDPKAREEVIRELSWAAHRAGKVPAGPLQAEVSAFLRRAIERRQVELREEALEDLEADLRADRGRKLSSTRKRMKQHAGGGQMETVSIPGELGHHFTGSSVVAELVDRLHLDADGAEAVSELVSSALAADNMDAAFAKFEAMDSSEKKKLLHALSVQVHRVDHAAPSQALVAAIVRSQLEHAIERRAGSQAAEGGGERPTRLASVAPESGEQLMLEEPELHLHPPAPSAQKPAATKSTGKRVWPTVKKGGK